MRAALICVVLAAWAGNGWAQSTATDRAADIRAAFDTGSYTRAFELSTAAYAEHPTDQDVAYLHAFGLAARNRNTESIAVCERALAEGGVRQIDLLTLIGTNHSALGNYEQALEYAQRALVLDPTDEDASYIEADAQQERRIRSGEKLPLPPGEAAEFVDAFLARVEAGDALGAVNEWFDPDVVDQILSAVGGPGGNRNKMLAAMTGGMREAWNKQYGQAGNAYIGFEVDPAAQPDETATTARVTAFVVQERRFSADEIRRLQTLVGTPALRQYADAEMVAIVDALDPSEHDAYFATLGQAKHSTLLELGFVVQRGADGWKVSDLLLGTPPTSVTDLARDLAKFAEAGLIDDVPRRKTKTPYERGYEVGTMVGRLIVLFGVIALIVWLIRRRRS